MYGANSLLNLLNKLQALFKIFLACNIFINPTKSYLNYPNMVFLDQQVNFFGLTTLDGKFKAIQLLT